MECPQCHAQNPADAAFCEECGSRLEAVCPSCGEPNRPTAKFCKKCGQPIAEAGPLPSPKFGSPDTYTPKHLAEKILAAKTTLEGERKQVTVLFADIKDSTELIQGLDPEQAVKRLEPGLKAMMEAVHRYEGTVNRVQGDGIMALFGAPIAHEDHAVRASFAALAMQSALESVSRDGLRIRVGLNSGEVVVRSIRNDLTMEYEAEGATVHLAARMEQLAQPGTIRLTATTYRLAEGFIRAHPLGPTPVKGMTKPVEVFELTGARAMRTRWEVRAARGLTKFVGREQEIQSLARALEQAVTGQGQVVAVVGEPGVGKSRLVHEFVHADLPEGCTVLETGGAPHGKNITYLPLSNLLRALFAIEDRDLPSAIGNKVREGIAALDEALFPVLPAVCSVLNLPVEDVDWQQLDPPRRRRRIMDAIKALMLRQAQAGSLLLVFEDLHWLDAETQAVLDKVVESLGAGKLLLVVTYRPEYEHQWVRKSYYSRIRIDPLGAKTAYEFLRFLIGDDSSLDRLKPLLIERTEGTPLFLEETVRTLVETGALEGTRGRYRLTQDINEVEIPATVQAVLAARIDRLPPEHKNLLQIASVIGKDVPTALLEPIAELPEEELRQKLTELQAAEFLYETRLLPDREYTFKHALTHDVAYSSVLQAQRRILHANIMEAIERLYPDRLADQVDRRGHHAFHGEVWDKAVFYLRQAGVKAFERSANWEAVRLFEQALEALRNLSESRDSLEAGIDLRFHLRNSLWALAEFRQLSDRLREAESLAKTLADQRRLGRAFAYTAACLLVMGEHDRALESGQRALGIARELGDFPVQVIATFYLGMTYYALGDYHLGAGALRDNVASLEGDLTRQFLGMGGLPSVVSRHWLAWCLAELGEFAEGIRRGEEAVRIAEAVDQPYSLVAAVTGVGFAHFRKGDLPKAVNALERGLALCQEWNFPLFFGWLAACLGAAYALLGHAAKALPLLEEAVEQTARKKMMSLHSLLLVSLSEVYLLTGRTDDALALAMRALELSDVHKERGNQAYACRLIGDIASRQEPQDVEKAQDYYRQAIALADELGMRPLLAHCYFGLGRLCRQTGDPKKGEQHISDATGLFREMDMRFWLNQAEVELRDIKR